MPPRTRNISGATQSVEKSSKSLNTSRRAVKRKVDDATDTESGSDFGASTTQKRQRSTKRTRSTLSNSQTEPTGENNEEKISIPPVAPKVDWTAERPTYLPAVLSFSYEDAKSHLIRADQRFEAIFQRLPCRPFVQLERVEPFRCISFQ
jgi:DNA-3-methyladenine glycosylase II